jgi:Polyketide cyclase / dehydrase and lipid transport
MRPGHPLPRSATRHAWLRALVAMFALAANAVLAAESPIKSLDVAFDGEAYVVNAVFAAPVPQAIAWDVLTDFDKLAGWVPNVTESKAIKREESSVVVEQKGVARYGLASFPYTSERKIDLKKPSFIKTAQIKGNMRRVESTLMIEPDGNGMRIVYHLEIVPNAAASVLMSKKFVEHEVTEQFTAIVGEMTRRAP